MRKSQGLRIVALVALLGVLGLVCAGCIGSFSFTIIWGRGGFFEEYTYWIGREDASRLGDFYASYVYVESVDGSSQSLTRSEVVDKWDDYFDRYYISTSYLISTNQRYNDGIEAIVDVERYERRRNDYTWEVQNVTVHERYTLRRISNKWRIVSVRERSLHVR